MHFNTMQEMNCTYDKDMFQLYIFGGIKHILWIKRVNMLKGVELGKICKVADDDHHLLN